MYHCVINDDFDLAKIADSGQCFRWERQSAEGEEYRIISGDRSVYVTRIGEREFSFSCDEEEFHAFWRSYFDLDTSYREIRAGIDKKKDPFLAQAAEKEQGIRILRQDPWETLVSFIISQNRNIPTIRRSIERLCGLAGEKRMDARGCVFYAFPVPGAVAALGEAELADCRLGYRASYVHGAAEAVRSGAIDLSSLISAAPEEQERALTSLRGVGIKVASCVRLFGLHSLDALPIDVWVRRILDNEYPDGYPFERNAPFNGVMQQYMFAYYRLQAMS
ncbi:DNA-3-methyladenine glycosylase family protein [Lachnoclostridium sp. Marseille-P6806]|uniref:DNA-3-methyladenine glycosylase family protein n=1 Tax=Lachnoclostridium sp. Marseille-P6806 TaxID=2364793 RepID=UPI00103023D0|nr:DNA glycosylase [Lachnoclostridium sp. Marseille-P6806]